MAKETVGVEVDVKFQSVGNMKKELREATQELIAMQQQFGKSSEQAINAAKKVADLKDTIQDAKEQADLFDPGNKFKAFSNAATQVAAGFTAVQGAMALVGSESEDVQKSLLKVQGALALSQGLSEIGDLGKAFDELKIVAVNAFRSIKAAIGSTGIGLLVVALGSVVAYWDDIKAAVSGVSEEQNKLNKASSDNLKTQQDKLKAIGDQDNILKLQGKSEKEILQSKIKQTDETIKAAEVNLQNNIATLNAQTKAEQRNKEILEGLLKFVSLPITAILKGIDLIGSAVGKNFGLEEKFFGGLASFIFDPEETKKKGDETIKEQEQALTNLKNQRAGFQLQVQQMNKDEAKKNKDHNDKIAAQNKEKNDKIRQQEREHREKLKKEEDDWNEYNERINAETLEKEQKIINDNQAEVDAADKREFDRFQKRIQTQLDYNQAVIKAEEDLSQAKFEAAQAGIGLLSTLVGKNKALSNTLFAIDKGLAIAKVVVDTQKEIAGYYANPTWKLLPDGGTSLATAAALKAKIRAGISIATIAATSISKYMNGGGSVSTGGGGMDTKAPMMPTLSPTVQTNVQNAQAINQMSSQSTRAYVLNSDIQNEQQRNAYLQRNASI